MAGRHYAGALLALTAVAGPVGARSTIDFNGESGGGSGRSVGAIALPPYLQCVPYARQVTGVNIYGDAHTWWSQAEGRYARGREPKVGAVMAFRPFGNSHLGHVAAVSKIVDSRTLLISHANWSPINGRRGQIERNVRAVDVSPNNDWSQVRVWFAPIKALGGTAWPVTGFIYNKKPGADKFGGEKITKPQLIKVARTAEEKSALVKQFAAKSRAPAAKAEARVEAAPPRAPLSNDPIGQIIARKRR
ncbi:CHAP domain-containing protein [Novosphingobium sp. JCM 18896]|uniref:CHAP domain-containing protein n=1 Tax=Novosphingobium sp. JCM 18896 TaxID=2989731 RepID=UPI0022218ECE|nr:CHAP domain-containing protein [Novosphingobium sp. JCM 18896]MCW1427672.1 CHAP domain-containing protein [Novosphingobium sp. JCM 18896]